MRSCRQPMQYHLETPGESRDKQGLKFPGNVILRFRCSEESNRLIESADKCRDEGHNKERQD